MKRDMATELLDSDLPGNSWNGREPVPLLKHHGIHGFRGGSMIQATIG